MKMRNMATADADTTSEVAAEKKSLAKGSFTIKPEEDWDVITHRLSRIFKVSYLIRLVLVELVVYLILVKKNCTV